jgi:hypothetical protein
LACKPSAVALPEHDESVALIVLGDAGAPGEDAGRVAQRLDRVLAHERRRGHGAIVLWLGNNISPVSEGGPCPALTNAWQRPGSEALAGVVRAHIAAGSSSFAALGEDEWRCGYIDTLTDGERSAAVHPWSMPAPHYVVAVDRRGRAEVRSRCAGDRCSLVPPRGDPIVELVFVDATTWSIPPESPAAVVRSRRALAQLQSLLGALAREPDRRTPRILVSHLPIEAASVHGYAAHEADSTFVLLFPPLQDSLRSGGFVGVIAAHDSQLHIVPDLGPAIFRSARTWIERPVFQVVASASERPRDSAFLNAARLSSEALVPPVQMHEPGFAVLHVGEAVARVDLHGRGHAGWRVASATVALRPAKRPRRTEAHRTAPCLRCPDVPVHQR